MLKPINSIIKDNIGNIIYRGNVVTGTVATDNGDGSYDVFISESDRAYPKIFTLSRNPDLAIGDKVRILYKNGCKELPIILPPVKTTAVVLTMGYEWGPEGGTTIPIIGEHSYPIGTEVEITAYPTGYFVFLYWVGDVIDPGANPTTVIMDKDKTVNIAFGIPV